MKNGAVKVVFFTQILGETGNGFISMVMVVADHKDDMGSGVAREAEGRFVGEVGTRDGGAPVLFDVFDHHFSAAVMADFGLHGGIVKAVGHVTHQQNIKAEVRKLADAEGAAEDTHVGVHAHEDDVFDALLAKQVINVFAIANSITIADLDSVVLMGLGSTFGDGAFPAVVGIVDGQWWLDIFVEVVPL